MLGHARHRSTAFGERSGRVADGVAGTFDLAPSERWLVNPGAVGQSRDRAVHARVALLDLGARRVTFTASPTTPPRRCVRCAAPGCRRRPCKYRPAAVGSDRRSGASSMPDRRGAQEARRRKAGGLDDHLHPHADPRGLRERASDVASGAQMHADRAARPVGTLGGREATDDRAVAVARTSCALSGRARRGAIPNRGPERYGWPTTASRGHRGCPWAPTEAVGNVPELPGARGRSGSLQRPIGAGPTRPLGRPRKSIAGAPMRVPAGPAAASRYSSSVAPTNATGSLLLYPRRCRPSGRCGRRRCRSRYWRRSVEDGMRPAFADRVTGVVGDDVVRHVAARVPLGAPPASPLPIRIRLRRWRRSCCSRL